MQRREKPRGRIVSFTYAIILCAVLLAHSQGQVNVGKVDVTANKSLGKRFGIKVRGRG